MKMHVIAAALAAASAAVSPVQHWYTEDSRSSTCVTLETAYSDMGAPHTPEQLLAVLKKLGRSYEMVRNDSTGVILAVRGTNFAIAIFRTEKSCNNVLQDVLRRNGPTGRG